MIAHGFAAGPGCAHAPTGAANAKMKMAPLSHEWANADAATCATARRHVTFDIATGAAMPLPCHARQLAEQHITAMNIY